MSEIWVEREIDLIKSKKLEVEASLSPITAKLLVSRGIENKEHAEAFLFPNFKTSLHNPFKLKDIDRVVERIIKAIDKKEKVLCHGDYDADGVTTITVYVKAFKLLGLDIEYYAPNRFKDGYGINMRNAPKLAEYDLVISGDTGIKQFDTAYELTHTYQTDLIVTDHHEPVVYPINEKNKIPENTLIIEHDEEVMALPICYAVINPKRIDCDYEGKDLSGAGVAFKVMEAVFNHLGKPKKELYSLLDYVTAGLIPDMVPLFNVERNSFEVRNLIKLGLNIMNNNPKPWVWSVLEHKNINREIVSTDLGYTFGPMLNAAGRLYDPTPAAEFLMEENEDVIAKRLEYLDGVNKERQKISADNTKKILAILKELPSERTDFGIVVDSSELHVGITGLVAGNVLKEYYRTTIAFAEVVNAEGETVYKGSARSIDGINVLDALIGVEGRIGSYIYGGHEQAAGITLKKDQLVKFREAFREECKSQSEKMGEEVFEPKKMYDISASFRDITFEFIQELDRFQPFGMGNEEPVFHASDVIISKCNLTKTGKAIQLDLKQKDGTRLKGICFSKVQDVMERYQKALENHTYVPCEILGFPQINEYNGNINLQFVVNEIKFPSVP